MDVRRPLYVPSRWSFGIEVDENNPKPAFGIREGRI